MDSAEAGADGLVDSASLADGDAPELQAASTIMLATATGTARSQKGLTLKVVSSNGMGPAQVLPRQGTFAGPRLGIGP